LKTPPKGSISKVNPSVSCKYTDELRIKSFRELHSHTSYFLSRETQRPGLKIGQNIELQFKIIIEISSEVVLTSFIKFKTPSHSIVLRLSRDFDCPRE
jgi:hypothetical protein